MRIKENLLSDSTNCILLTDVLPVLQATVRPVGFISI